MVTIAKNMTDNEEDLSAVTPTKDVANGYQASPQSVPQNQNNWGGSLNTAKTIESDPQARENQSHPRIPGKFYGDSASGQVSDYTKNLKTETIGTEK